jgi:hypothetical protein
MNIGLSTLYVCMYLLGNTAELVWGFFFQKKDFRGFLYLSSISPGGYFIEGEELRKGGGWRSAPFER